MKKLFLGVLTALALAAGGTFAGTLDDVKARGNLLCGVSTGAPGFATVDAVSYTHLTLPTSR